MDFYVISEVMTALWRIPAIIWEFIRMAFVEPILAGARKVAGLLGLGFLLEPSTMDAVHSMVRDVMGNSQSADAAAGSSPVDTSSAYNAYST